MPFPGPRCARASQRGEYVTHTGARGDRGPQPRPIRVPRRTICRSDSQHEADGRELRKASARSADGLGVHRNQLGFLELRPTPAPKNLEAPLPEGCSKEKLLKGPS